MKNLIEKMILLDNLRLIESNAVNKFKIIKKRKTRMASFRQTTFDPSVS